MTTQTATAEQVRKDYEDRGFVVRIGDDGHVEFSENGNDWLEGRWVCEYRVIDGQIVLS